MNKGMLAIIIVIVLIVVAGGGYYYLHAKSSQTAMMHDTMAKSNGSMMKDNGSMKGGTMMPAITGMMQENSLTMMMKDAKLGSIVTDAKGMTLYTYDKDTKGQSNCSGQCAVYWPPYVVSGSAPASLPAHLGTIKRADGSMQYTWDGMPLYYYASDKKAGDTTGDGVGGVWHVVK